MNIGPNAVTFEPQKPRKSIKSRIRAIFRSLFKRPSTNQGSPTSKVATLIQMSQPFRPVQTSQPFQPVQTSEMVQTFQPVQTFRPVQTFQPVQTSQMVQRSQATQTTYKSLTSQTVQTSQTAKTSKATQTSQTALTPSKSPTFDFPLEIVALVLDYLPQHRVYPFLSLSKGVNYIATQRLLRHVYVLKRRDKPYFDDAVDELYHWSLLTGYQFFHLMRCYDKWPGTTVIYEPIRYSAREKRAIKAFVAPPATLVANSLTDSRPPFNRMPVSTLPASPTTHHFARFTLTESVVLRPLPVKIKVDNLSIFGTVRGIDKCIDLSSVRQLSLVSGNFLLGFDVFCFAHQFTRLEDLFIGHGQYWNVNLLRFPKTVKRLVMSWHEPDVYATPHCFNSSLEYLEFADDIYWQNWPRRLLKSKSNRHVVKLSPRLFPKLKLVVRHGSVCTIKRMPDERSLDGGSLEEHVNVLFNRHQSPSTNVSNSVTTSMVALPHRNEDQYVMFGVATS